MTETWTTIGPFVQAAIVAGLTTSAAWVMKKVIVGIIVGIGRLFGLIFRVALNAIKWKIGWY